jgi:hypothetical protein
MAMTLRFSHSVHFAADGFFISSHSHSALAGKRFWTGKRDPLTSQVEVTAGAVELTLDWFRKESGGRSL